jgi:hypothetical protein
LMVKSSSPRTARSISMRCSCAFIPLRRG